MSAGQLAPSRRGPVLEDLSFLFVALPRPWVSLWALEGRAHYTNHAQFVLRFFHRWARSTI
jgi:hypothetical protein